MENEFDFFNNLKFGTDFTKQNLGGYGTFSGEYLDPTVTSPINTPPVLEGIQTAAPIDIIPAPITPFINKGNDDGGITTINNSNNLYNKEINDSYAELGNPDYQGNLETAKNDTNIKDLVNMGLVDKAKNYVKNNYGYMIMNLIFPGSGIVAKDVIERKNKREDAARRVEEENILLDKQNALIASKEAEEAAFQATLNQQQERQRRADLERIERAYRQDTGSGGGSYAPGGGSGSHAPDASGSTYSDPFDPGGGEKDGGHIDGTNRRRYGMGGIVSL